MRKQFKLGGWLALVTMVLAALPMVSVGNAAAVYPPPNGSFLGTQPITDNFNCPNKVESPYSPISMALSGSTMAGYFFNLPNCQTLLDYPNLGLFTQALGSNTWGQVSGGVSGQSKDCGQEIGQCVNSYSISGQCSSPCNDSTSYTCTTGPCATFYIPNYGQLQTQVDISTGIFVVGGLYVQTDPNCAPVFGCSGNQEARASLLATMNFVNTATSSVSTMNVIDDTLDCTSSSNSCTQTAFYDQDFSPNSCTNTNTGKTGTCSATFYLPPGYYVVTLSTSLNVYNHLEGGTGNAWACIWYNSNCTAGIHVDTCPAGVPTYNGHCQYIQWKWLTYTIHGPDFSVSTPSSLTLSAGSSTSTILTVNSVLQGGNDAYSLQAPVTLSVTSDDANLQFNANPNPVTPPAGLGTSTTLTVSDSNACHSGSYTITLSASVNDASGQAPSQGHIYNILITVNRTCDFTNSVAPNTVGKYCNPVGGYCIQSSTARLTITSMSTWSGTVNLSYISPANNGGSSLTGPASAWLNSGGSVTVTLNASPPSNGGDYYWTIRGSNEHSIATTSLDVYYHVCTRGCPTQVRLLATIL